MKHKISINRLFFYYISILLLMLLSSCESAIDNSQGITVDFISSYGKNKFKYHCSQSNGFGVNKIIITDDANKYNIGDTLIFLCKHCK